ncbi:LMBR1 domain-containing protein 2 homolog A-like [Triticum dicoccoides]|uniref:LMBR1 domain-containing protein 2 homolog A-like n=1 Tax=Triticum dicoccoides TaxID=85692 RepID=UPI00189122DA|nr:LMBR1 domain-containing protein 2 homolog A-like [Triticum dicoccoides]
MWVFYLIALPLTVGMVAATLRYFAGPAVPLHVLATVGYAWLCSLSFVILVPTDIYTTITGNQKGDVGFFWSWSYWSSFVLAWAIIPTIKGYEDAGDFTVKERLKTSIRANLLYYEIVGSIGFFGIVLIIIMHHDWGGAILGFAMACSNTFGLVTGAFLLGFGLSEIPKDIWRNADWTRRQKILSHMVAKMTVKLDNARQEYCNTITVVQATSKQMSKRDPLRPFMDIIDNMLAQMLRDDPLFKLSGGNKLAENDMDYDTDKKTMAALRRRLRIAHEEYCRCKSKYTTSVMEALELEDTVTNYEQHDADGWKYVSDLRESRSGTLGSFLDHIEFIWRCILLNRLLKVLSVLLGCISAAILLAEATLLPTGVHLSLFSVLINAAGKQEILVQVVAFAPLMYMCICTYYPLFRIGMMVVYSLTPGQTSSVSLLMICSMVARYAPAISYNFLNLVHLGGDVRTTFEKRMGSIDDAVPFFGRNFNRIYPLIMVVYTILVAGNFFSYLFEIFGSWKRFKFWTEEEEDTNGFDPSGVMILQKERSWIEQARKLGEQVTPLARNFSSVSEDVESGTMLQGVEKLVVIKAAPHSPKREGGAQSKYGVNADHKYSSITEQPSSQKSVKQVKEETRSTSTSVLLEAGDSENPSPPVSVVPDLSAGTASRWASMKAGFRSFKSSMSAKRLLPSSLSRTSSSTSDSLDEIFRGLKRHSSNPRADVEYLDEDDSALETDRAIR